ncbi:MAG: hypothetical protein FWF02_00640 [Micrococcales bacterium]|nr:hypothetical protein [Micrococcales bacterium]MCL2666205.1 hypothetical protein [Micrococcales bacterium]
MADQHGILPAPHPTSDAAYYELVAHEKWLWDSRSRERDAREEGSQTRAVTTARNALRMGLPVDQVTTITGLSADEVVRLAAEG